MNENQQKIYKAIADAAALKTPFDRITVEQTPTFLQDPVRVADFAPACSAHSAPVSRKLARAVGCQDKP